MKRDDTRENLKLAARRLFARRGIDGVSVREIVSAAGQRNGASLHYYFGTKEALVRELVLDGAKIIDDRRNAILDALDRDGGPTSLRQVIDILVRPSIGLGRDSGEEDSYVRFITMLQHNHRTLFLDALEGRWNSGYLRCLAHIRALLPAIPPLLLNQRLVFMSFYLGGVLSSREAALEVSHRAHHFWAAGYTTDNFIDTIQGLLEQPLSAATRAAFRATGDVAKEA